MIICCVPYPRTTSEGTHPFGEGEVVPYSGTSEVVSFYFGGGENGPLSQDSVEMGLGVLGAHFIPIPPISSLPRVVCLLQFPPPISSLPVLEVRVDAAKEATRDNFLVRLHHPAGSWDTVRDGGGTFFIFFWRWSLSFRSLQSSWGDTTKAHLNNCYN